MSLSSRRDTFSEVAGFSNQLDVRFVEDPADSALAKASRPTQFMQKLSTFSAPAPLNSEESHLPLNSEESHLPLENFQRPTDAYVTKGQFVPQFNCTDADDKETEETGLASQSSLKKLPSFNYESLTCGKAHSVPLFINGSVFSRLSSLSIQAGSERGTHGNQDTQE